MKRLARSQQWLGTRILLANLRTDTIVYQWGEEVPLGQGEVNMPHFIQALKSIGYTGPLVVEREVGDQASRLRDVAIGLACLRDWLAS